jgi:hypothetical protein
MEHCVDYDLDPARLEEHRVREAPQEGTAHLAAHTLVRFGLASDQREARVDGM